MTQKKLNIKQKRYIKAAAVGLAVLIVYLSVFGDNVGFSWNSAFRKFGLLTVPEEDADYIRFIDVGQGDCILIYSNGQSMLIDTGPEDCAENLCSELESLQISRIDALLETHLHMDHVGGLGSVIERFDIINLMLPDLTSDSEGYPAAKAAKETVLEADGAIYTITPGMYVNIGEFEVTVIAYYPDMQVENDRSAVCVAKIGETKFLLCADAECPAELQMIEDNIDLDCDVIKVGHHGSKTSSCEKFLQAVTPDYAVISVAEYNDYSHPSEEVLLSLENIDSQIYRTDENGSITFYIEDDKIKVETEK